MSNKGKTGEKVTASGTYKNRYGKEVMLKENEIFPACPVKGHEIEWEKVR